MKLKFYKAKERGHCGPCSFINLLGIKGSLKLERSLIESGRAKPFHNSDWTSFLIWADLYKKDLMVYLTTAKFHEKKYERLGRWSNYPKKEFEKLRLEAKKRYDRLLEKYKSKIKIIKDPLKKLDELLGDGKNVAFAINTFYYRKKPFMPHFFVIYKKEGKYYHIMDSAYGLIKLTRVQLKKGIELNKKSGRYPQIIVEK
jgi:hypothetical protein